MLEVGKALAQVMTPPELCRMILNKLFAVPLWKIPDEQEFIQQMLVDHLEVVAAMDPERMTPDECGAILQRVLLFLAEAARIGGPEVKEMVAAELLMLKALDTRADEIAGEMDRRIQKLEEGYSEWRKAHPVVGVVSRRPEPYPSCLSSMETVVELVKLNLKFSKPDGPIEYPIVQVTE